MRLSYPKLSICVLVGTILTALSPASSAEVNPRIDADIPSYIARESLSGRLTIAVTEAMVPLVQAWAGNLMGHYPELQIVVISERHTGLAALLAQQTELMVLSCRMTPAEVGNYLLEFGDKPIALPVAHHPQVMSVRNDDSAGYKIHTVKGLWSNTMVSDGYVTLGTRSEMTVLHTFRRSVYLYSVKSQGVNATHASAELIRYALSRQGQQVALDLGYVPLSFEEVRRVTSRWSASRR
jgi:ABC-type phosphate transport system substrate-binding protein